jgi:hypothetical protein
MIRSILKTLKVIQNADAVDLTLAASWATATDLGDLKGKPFLKVTWDNDTVDTQAGKSPLNLTAKFETSSFQIDSATMTALKAMRGMNVSLLATPQGTVSATNQIVIVKNFKLQLSGEINLGDASFVKLAGEKPVYDEDEAFELLDAALGV